MRYLAVDFYRGLTITFMIIVNTAGTWDYVYAPLRHAEWHGCTPTDLVFPSFMFIIGTSMWFSFAKYDRKWNSEVGWKVLNRVALLFLIGLILNKFPFLWRDWQDWRIWGVPQRLALGYGLAALLVLNVQRRTLIWISAGLLLLYWGLLHFGGVPGSDPYSLDFNAVLRLDRWMLGDAHLYHGERIAFDPEGLLSTIPSVVTVILGWLAAEVLHQRSERPDLAVRDLLAYGVICGFIGLTWDLFFPINKKLWTSSYVLYAGGLSMILLAASVWLLDVRKWRSGAGFFFTFGANPLFAYVLSEALVISWFSISWVQSNEVRTNVQEWIFNHAFAPIDPHQLGSFLFAFAYMLLCWAVCRWLYVRKIFIKI